MTTAHRTKPQSEILAPAADPAAEAPTDEKPAAAAEVPEVPEKYQGKSVGDVIDMHQNAEKRLGEIQNELGTMRGLVTDLSALQRPAPEPQPAAQEPVDVSGDDLLSDPVAAVQKILQPELDKLSAASDKRAADDLFQTEGKALLEAYPELDSTVRTAEFQDFVNRTPSRQAELELASRGTGVAQVRAANRLMEDYTDFQTTASAEKTDPTPVEEARKVATEAAGTGAPISGKPQIFEHDVIALINSDSTKYRSPSYQKELMAAIKEGRFVKNT